MLLLHHFLRDTAHRRPDQIALIRGDRRLAFGRLEQDSDRLACELRQSGVRRGDRVAVMMENSIELVTSLFGILKAGGVFVVLNATTKSKKLSYILNDCGVRALITHPALARTIVPVLQEVPSLGRIVWTDNAPTDAPGGRTLSQILTDPHASPADPGLIDEDLCAIIYTSGSTGQPKGVMLTHRNVSATACSIASYLENVPEDVVACVLPLSFGYGLCQIAAGAKVGYTVLLEESFAFPFDVLRRMAQHRVTGLPGVPTMYAAMIQVLPSPEIDLSSLRYLTNAAARLSPAHIRQLAKLFPQARIFSMYGQTECLRTCYLDPARILDKIESVGKAMPNCEAYVVDEQGRRVGPGTTGELVVRGANVMRGYWGKPEETGQRLRDGDIPGEKVLYSGDLFRTDEEGLLYFVARKDDVFKCKGEKISPREIEDALYELDSVAEAAVVGVEDPIDGQAIKAFIVPRNGSAPTEQLIRRHCRARLEGYMVPKFVEIVASLPKTDSGKIRRRSLIEGSAKERQDAP